MDVRVLGQIDARSDTQPYALGGPTQRRVFAALVVRRGEVVDVSALIDVCWPGGDIPDRAEHNVHTYVHRLRSALHDDGTRIETVGTGYRLHVERDEVDLDRLDDLANSAASSLSIGDMVGALDAINEADRLWRGRPYGQFADEPWAMAEVAHFSEVKVALEEHRAEALLAAGRPGDAVVGLERLIVEHPLRERPRSLLMRVLYESGRQAEALRAFQAFRRFLIDESGVEPSRNLVELDRRIADGTLSGAPIALRAGSYELHERIGEGAVAVVHRATQPSLGREVAIKVIRAELANRSEFIRRFAAEAQMVARIEHPNVVPLYDYWREPGRAFLVMRWMTGGSLQQRLDDGRLDLDAIVSVIDDIAGALDAAHSHGIVHRDVRPANIFFDERRRSYLGDFDVALDSERSTPDAALSEGSPAFASPEQLRREPVSPETDVHALGIVAFTALTGHIPFHDVVDPDQQRRRQLDDPIPSVSSAVPGLPRELDDVLAMATAKRAQERYHTAGAFAAAFRRAAGRATAPRVAAIGEGANPYRGLRAFTEADASMFYGRTRLVHELLDAFADDRRLLAVVGPSGSGKSSAVRAGLVPALRSNGVAGSSEWFLTTMTPGGSPYEALETALLRVGTNAPAALLDQLRDGDRGIHRAVTRIVPDDDSTVLVIIDQFEELFTATGDAERQRFLGALATAVTEPGGPLRVVATMRADFYDQPLRYPAFASLFKHGTVAITPLSPDELHEAITAPASAFGVGYEPGLIAEIVADVNSQPGALPLLQFALTQAFDATDGDMISTATYHEMGGLTSALARRAEALYEESDDVEQRAARRLFGRLVNLGDGTEDTRRRIRRSELPSHAATERVIERYGGARLLTFDSDPATRDPTIEIAHEALIREWSRLREWLDEDRDALRTHRHLTTASTAWEERARDVNELYRGGRLDVAESLLGDDRIVLNRLESEYLVASIERRESTSRAERQRVRRLRRLVAVTAFVAAIAIVAGVVAVVQGRQVAAERDARDLVRLRAEAVALSERIPQAAILLAIEADRSDPSVLTKDALHRTLTSPSPLVDPGAVQERTAGNQLEEVVDLDEDQVALLASPGAQLHLALRQDGDVVLTAVGTPSGASEVTRHERTEIGWSSSPTGRSALVAGTGDHTLWIDDVVRVIGPDDQPTGLTLQRPSDLVAFAISRNGAVVALANADGALDLHDSHGTRLGTLRFPSPAVLADGRVRIDLSDDGSLLAAQVNGEVSGGSWLFATTQPARVVDSGTTITTLDILSKSLQRPFVSRHQLYVSPPQTNYLYPVDPSTGDIVGPRTIGHTSSITDVAESEEMGLLATASLDGTVRVWDRSSGRPLGREIVVDTYDIVFDSRGRLVVPHDDHLSFWNYDISTWQAIGCLAARRNLTRDEWEEYGPTSREYRATCEQYPIES